MIRNRTEFTAYDGNTCYCGTMPVPFDALYLTLSADSAHYLLQELISYGYNEKPTKPFTYTFYQEVKEPSRE